jgi:hypothetical protein
MREQEEVRGRIEEGEGSGVEGNKREEEEDKKRSEVERIREEGRYSGLGGGHIRYVESFQYGIADVN